jgi:hypothetical protein
MVFAYSSVMGGDPPITTKIRCQETSKTRTLTSLAGFLLSHAATLALLYIGGIGFV